MKQIDFNALKVGDALVTRDGRKARVIATDIKDSDQPLAVAVRNENEELEEVLLFTADGRYFIDDKISSVDLFMPQEMLITYHNVYFMNGKYSVGWGMDTREEAIKYRMEGCIKTIEIKTEI